jgi:hypothetical protein
MLMNGNFDNPLSFVQGTDVLVMAGPLIADTQPELSTLVRIEVKLLDGNGNVVEKCDSGQHKFSPAPDPGSHWVMTKSTNKVTSGQTLTGSAKAFDDKTGQEVTAWEAQITIA